MVCFSYVVVNIAHKVDNKDNDNMGNWNHLKIIYKGTEQDTLKTRHHKNTANSQALRIYFGKYSRHSTQHLSY